MKDEVNEWPEYLAYQTTAYILNNSNKFSNFTEQ